MADQSVPPGMGNQPNPAEPQKSGGLFGGSKKPQNTNQMQDIILQLNDVSRRLLILEERYSNLRKKTQITDQNMLENSKGYNKQLATMRDSLASFSHQLGDTNDKIKLVIRELQEGAKKQDVDVLTRYVDMWNPVNFVSRDEVFKLIKDQVETTMMDLNLKIQQEEFIKDQIERVIKKNK